MRVLRRSIIVICSIFLIPLIILVFASFPRGKYFTSNLKAQVKSGKADVIEVNKKIKIDNDTIFIERIINTATETTLRYKVIEAPGWSFSNSALVLYDEKRKKNQKSGESIGKIWGEDGIISYDRIDKESKEITISLEWFDRRGNVVIPIRKGEYK